ncbi:hypothetical protein JCM3765_005434 [Sporobolomyces pararoseus]
MDQSFTRLMEVRALAALVITKFKTNLKDDPEHSLWDDWMKGVKEVFNQDYLSVQERCDLVKLELNLLEALIVYVDLSVAQIRAIIKDRSGGSSAHDIKARIGYYEARGSGQGLKDKIRVIVASLKRREKDDVLFLVQDVYEYDTKKVSRALRRAVFDIPKRKDVTSNSLRKYHPVARRRYV